MQDLRKEQTRKSDMMARKALLDAITKRSDAYREVYPKTADSDLKLVMAYCSGSSAAHVALDHHCVDSTVYRAINRVQEFIRMYEADDRWKPLIDHIMEHVPNFRDCNAQSILEMLYEEYCDWNDFDDEATRESFQELHMLLGDLCATDTEPVMSVIYNICRNHQRTGICEGIKLGIRLGEELRA